MFIKTNNNNKQTINIIEQLRYYQYALREAYFQFPFQLS